MSTKKESSKEIDLKSIKEVEEVECPECFEWVTEEELRKNRGVCSECRYDLDLD